MRHARRPLQTAGSEAEIARSPSRLISRSVITQRELFVEELVIMQTSISRIVELARRPTGPVQSDPNRPGYGMLLYDGRPPGLGIGATATRNLIARVIEKLQQQSEANKVTNKPNAEARLIRHIRDSRKRGQWGAVAQFERLLSDIQGTRSPLRVDVNVTTQTALMNVIGTMSPEQMNELLTEYEELETRAGDGSLALVQVPKVAAKMYEVKGLSGDYLVTVEPDGKARCTCPDFQHRGHERPCKHVLGIVGAVPQTGLRRGAA